jgi:hypothetical protein
VEVSKAIACLQCAKLLDSFDHVALEIEIDQLRAIPKRINTGEAVLREIDNPQLIEILQRG